MTRFRLVRFLLLGVAAIVAVGIVASIGLRVVGAMRLRAASERFERQVGSLSLLDFVKPRIPAETNAVTWLRPGVLSVVLFPADRTLVGRLSATPSSQWTAEDLAAFEPLSERNRPALEILGRARGLTGSNWEIPYQKGTAAELPNLRAAIDAGKFLAARGRIALAQGDRETAVSCVEILGVLAASHQQEGSVMLLLIGSALERLQLALLREIVTSPGVETGELDRVERSLGDTELGKAFRNAMRGEAAALIHDFHAEEFQKELPRTIPRSLAIGLADILLAASIQERLEVEPGLYGPITAPLPDASAEYANAGWWKRIVAAYGPNIAGTAARGTGTMSARHLARMSIGLRRQALATGAYPPTIETPVDPLSGERFAYAATASGVELRSTTTPEILKSIYPVGTPLSVQLFSWPLPSGSRASTPSPSPAARTGASPS